MQIKPQNKWSGRVVCIADGGDYFHGSVSDGADDNQNDLSLDC